MQPLKKQILFCTIGSILEWYEFMVFAVLTPIISSLFFPHSNHFAAMMSTFAIFASGYIMRPIGAIFFGHLGDTIGRKYTLMITLFLMTASTFAMGCIPVGYSFSALVLLLCRLAQGFSASGEYPAVLTLISEQKNQKHEGFINSTAPFGTGMGCLLGAVLCTTLFYFLGHGAMLNNGWRIPFLLALPIGAISFILRKKINESVEFKVIKEQYKTLRIPFIKLITHHRRNLFVMLCISILANVTIYINFLYMSNTLVATHKITATQSSHLYLWIILLYSCSILLFGFLSDYTNKKIFLLCACVVMGLFAHPLCNAVFNEHNTQQFLAQGILAIFSGMILGPFASVLANGFPMIVRYTALSVVLNFAGSFFGGTAPIACGWLTKYMSPAQASSNYIIILSATSLLAILFITKKDSSKNNV